MKGKFIAASYLFLILFSCNQPMDSKAKGYQKIVFPEKKYIEFNEAAYPYTFEYPEYAIIDKKVEYFGEDKKGDAWLNVQYPIFKATLYLSHTPIGRGQFSLDTLVMDAFKFANNHNSMASSIEDSTFSLGNHMGGAFFHIGGDVATAYQFYLTDSTRHFIRGALYFDATPNQDSLAPVNAFLLEDIKHMVQHFHWK
jgi:gliding motility-associated lipoprotein GldD